MLTRNRLLPLLVLALALLSVWLKAPLASSQGLTITAAAVAGDLPLTDVQSALWSQATAVEVPLSAQMIAIPISPQANVKSVTARALHNGQQVALMVEWADATRNDSTLRVDDFRDGVAVQFPLAQAQPFFCMGQLGGDVNIWHWKADWQSAIIARRQLHDVYPNMYVDQYPFTEAGGDVLQAAYTDPAYLPALAANNLMAQPVHDTPVENLIAGGFGSLTSQTLDRQTIQGYGEWNGGVWRVIFSRDLLSAAAEDVSLTAGQIYSIAFAAWDGENDERNGTKSTSQWVSLQLGSAPPPAVAVVAETLGGPIRLPIWVWFALLALLTVVVASTMFYFSLRH
ncbi:MAG: hypothetical protein IT329_14550 [Caldilineaceae bacterium]|nr:hypothetical protein [Caldilineaceae bacterium]